MKYTWMLNISVFLQDILAGCKEALSLSSHSGVILERLSSSPLQKSCFLGSSSGDSSPGLSEVISASVSSSGSNPDINTKHCTLSAVRTLDSEQASHHPSSFLPNTASYTYFSIKRQQLLTLYFFLFLFISDYLFITLMHYRLLVMRRRMKTWSQMSRMCPVLPPYLPFPCCRPKPWKRQAASSNLNGNNKKRPRSDTNTVTYRIR